MDLSLILVFVFLALSIALVMRLFYQAKELESFEQNIHNLSIEIATLKQKNTDQTQRLIEKEGRIEELYGLQTQLYQSQATHKATIASLQTKLQEQQNTMEYRLSDLQSSRKMLIEEFEDLANKVFVASHKNLTEQNQESLSLILTPLKEQMQSFKAKVEEIHLDQTKEQTSLRNELKQLQTLNAQMSHDAINLTNALKSENKTQGSWGEMILERILEKSGLRLGEEYLRECVLKSCDGTLYRPDVIVKLSSGRDVIIDAKTSLKDYESYINQNDSKHLKAHTLSIKNHIKTLSQKRYEELDGVNSLDFILMFIPLSNALMVVLEHETGLYEEAYKNGVVLVSPQTLLLSLRAIENSWRYEKQAKNAIEVTRLAQKLYTKVKSFVDDLDKLGVALQKAQMSYNEAYGKLYSGKDNIIRQIESFKTKANIHPKENIASSLINRANEETME